MKNVQVISHLYLIYECKHVNKKGALLLGFRDLKIGSPYMKLVQAMKSKGANSKGMDIYCNFPLTARRSTLLYNVRQLWKNGNLGKFFADYTGDITVVPPKSSKKVKLTSRVEKESDYILWTFTITALKDQFGSQ